MKYLRGSLDGLPVLDATEPLTIRVVSEDIDYSKRKDPECCAFAQACVRELHVEKARVHLARVYVLSKDGTHWLRYQMPGSAQREVVSFDRGGTFKPGTFRFLPVSPSNQSDSRHAYTERLKNRRRPPARRYRPERHETEGVRAKSPLVGQPIEQAP